MCLFVASNHSADRDTVLIMLTKSAGVGKTTGASHTHVSLKVDRGRGNTISFVNAQVFRCFEQQLAYTAHKTFSWTRLHWLRAVCSRSRGRDLDLDRFMIVAFTLPRANVTGLWGGNCTSENVLLIDMTLGASQNIVFFPT